MKELRLRRYKIRQKRKYYYLDEFDRLISKKLKDVQKEKNN